MKSNENVVELAQMVGTKAARIQDGMKPIRQVDIDVGDVKEDHQRAPWSVAVLGVPLPMVGVLLAQTVAVVFWLGQQSTKLDTVIDQNKEIRTEIYKQADATRDLALRDDRISELGRRIENLERYIDGRRSR